MLLPILLSQGWNFIINHPKQSLTAAATGIGAGLIAKKVSAMVSKRWSVPIAVLSSTLISGIKLYHSYRFTNKEINELPDKLKKRKKIFDSFGSFAEKKRWDGFFNKMKGLPKIKIENANNNFLERKIIPKTVDLVEEELNNLEDFMVSMIASKKNNVPAARFPNRSTFDAIINEATSHFKTFNLDTELLTDYVNEYRSLPDGEE